jgi:hypothetical protein
MLLCLKRKLIITYEEPCISACKDLETISVREILDAVRISGDSPAGNKFIAIPEVDGLISRQTTHSTSQSKIKL